MRTLAAATLALLTLAGCSSGEPSEVDATANAVTLIRTAAPTLTEAEARKLMTDTCDNIARHPQAATLRTIRGVYADTLGGDAAAVAKATTIVGAAVGGGCPQYLELAKSAD